MLAGSAGLSDAGAFFLFDTPNAGPRPAAAYAPPPPRKARKLRAKRIDRIDRIDPAEKKQPPIASGVLQVVISINTQRLTLYSNGAPVAYSTVATGVPDHPTPSGIFSVIEKQRFHRSNLYSDAPMPFMQRITWSGVALHEGVVPGRPASHGCIRMPAAFARQMWATTKIGVRVIIAPSDVVPVEIAHRHLFAPKQTPPEKPAPSDAPVADQPPHRVETGVPVKTAEVTDRITATDGFVLRGSVKEEPQKVKAGVIRTVWTVSASLTAGLTGTIKAVEAAIAVRLADIVKTADAIALAKKAADRIRTVEAMRKAGPISVFVSRKEKKIFVRHRFNPVFEAPVTIRDAATPLGTHIYTAVELKDDGAAMRWMVASMPTDMQTRLEPPPKRGRKHGAEREPAPAPQAVAPVAALAALDRIEIAQGTLDRIAELLTPGASLIISDQGLGPETGRGTDFIVVTR